MALYPKFRDLHLYLGLVLLIPIVAISATGVVLNHKPLFLGQRAADPAADRADRQTAAPLRAQPAAWQAHAGTLDAALATAREYWGDAELEKIELKDDHRLGLIVKVKLPEDSELSPLEFCWSAAQGKVVEVKGDKHGATDWGKVMIDLHTGKLFSRRGGFLWSDSAAVALLCLSFTGVVLYVIPFWKRRTKRRAASPADQRPAGALAASRPRQDPAAEPARVG